MDDTDAVTDRLGHFELSETQSLLLRHSGSGRYVFALANVVHSHLYQVTGAQFAGVRIALFDSA
jgi:hypothetical protein